MDIILILLNSVIDQPIKFETRIIHIWIVRNVAVVEHFEFITNKNDTMPCTYMNTNVEYIECKNIPVGNVAVVEHFEL